MKTILYAASTASHLQRFHLPYIRALRESARVITLGSGEGVDFSLPLQKRMFSLKNLAAVRHIRRILKQERVDTVITNTALASFLIRLAVRGLKPRPRVLCIVHGYLFDGKGGVRDRLLLMAEKSVSRMTDSLLVMNREDERLAVRHRLGLTPPVLIHGMGFDNGRLPSLSRDKARELLALPKDDFVCLYVGELSKRKNQELLLRAVAALSDEQRPPFLCLVGDGSEREALIALANNLGISERVRFAGNLEDPELLSAYYAAADLYASASKTEGLPFNILEAMDARLPILASDCKGQSDLLEESEAVLYPVGDLDALIRGMKAGAMYTGERVDYPHAERYRLCSVFSENISQMREAAELPLCAKEAYESTH